MSISIEEAFADLHNLSVRQPLRRYHPQHMLIAVDANDQIIKTRKYKEMQTGPDEDEFVYGLKGWVFFIATPEIYPSVDKLHSKVADAGSTARRRMKERELGINRGTILIMPDGTIERPFSAVWEDSQRKTDGQQPGPATQGTERQW